MIRSVEIELDTETGAISVGSPPAAEENAEADQAEDKSYLQPSGSLAEALQTAKDLLSNPQQPGQRAAQQSGFESVDQGRSMAGMMDG